MPWRRCWPILPPTDTGTGIAENDKPILTLQGIFLDAAAAQPQQVLVADALLLAGVLPLASGIATLCPLVELSREAAPCQRGKEAVEALRAELPVSPVQAQEVPGGPHAAGQIRTQQRHGKAVYVGRRLQRHVATRRCPYCCSTFPVREAVRRCPNCSAPREIHKP